MKKTYLHLIWLIPIVIIGIIINYPYRIIEWFNEGSIIQGVGELLEKYLPEEKDEP